MEGFKHANYLRELDAKERGVPYEPLVRMEIREAQKTANQLPFQGSTAPQPAPVREPPKPPIAVRSPSVADTRDDQRPSSPEGMMLRSPRRASKFALRGEAPPPPARRAGEHGKGAALHTGRYAPWLQHALHDTAQADGKIRRRIDEAWMHREAPPLLATGHACGDYVTPSLASKRWSPPRGRPIGQPRANALLQQSYEAERAQVAAAHASVAASAVPMDAVEVAAAVAAVASPCSPSPRSCSSPTPPSSAPPSQRRRKPPPLSTSTAPAVATTELAAAAMRAAAIRESFRYSRRDAAAPPVAPPSRCTAWATSPPRLWRQAPTRLPGGGARGVANPYMSPRRMAPKLHAGFEVAPAIGEMLSSMLTLAGAMAGAAPEQEGLGSASRVQVGFHNFHGTG